MVWHNPDVIKNMKENISLINESSENRINAYLPPNKKSPYLTLIRALENYFDLNNSIGNGCSFMKRLASSICF